MAECFYKTEYEITGFVMKLNEFKYQLHEKSRLNDKSRQLRMCFTNGGDVEDGGGA